MSGRANRLYPTATPLCNRIRSFVNRSRPPVLKEPRGESDASSRAKQTDANQAPKNEACREVNLREKLVQQKKALHRALKRLQSRLALFKVFARYRELRRSHGSLSAVRRYLSEKSLKFGATRRNALRVKRMKELRDKVINKSTEWSITAMFAMKKYGKLGAGIYFGVYVVTLILMNILTFNGFLSSNDLRRLLERINVTHFQVPDMDSSVARFTVAYIATKVVEPLRLLVSILLVLGVNRVRKRL